MHRKLTMVTVVMLLVCSVCAFGFGFGSGGGGSKTTYSTPLTATGFIVPQAVEMLEGSASGTNKITLTLPTTIAADHIYSFGETGITLDGAPINADSTAFTNYTGANNARVAAKIDGSYDNTISGLTATTLKTAIDELKAFFSARIDALVEVLIIAGILPPPAVSLDTATLAFGNVSSASNRSQTFRITNSGFRNLSTTTVTGSGTDIAKFTNWSTCKDQVIAVNGYCDTTVTFTPGAAGDFTASLSIASNAPSTPDVVALSGTGVAPPVYYTGWSTTAPPTGTPASQYEGVNAVVASLFTASVSGTLKEIAFYPKTLVSPTYYWVVAYKDIAGTNSLVGSALVSSPTSNAWSSFVTLTAADGQSLSYSAGDNIYFGVAFYKANADGQPLGRDDTGGTGMYYASTVITGATLPATATFSSSPGRKMGLMLSYENTP